jgi:FAD/FMN-containing dehydrogenase
MQSWNFNPVAAQHRLIDVCHRDASLPATASPMLAFGLGRSYGDVCLNDGGTLLLTRRLNKFMAFDRVTGRLQCEAGVTLGEILQLVVPCGWFLSVTPGTRFVTVGGAIANDVHGKNHHLQGSFGHHVCQFELLRSNGERKRCSAAENPQWFAATIGGLGLTGLITWAEIQLTRVNNPALVTLSIKFPNLDGFWALNAATDGTWPYTVAWIDCLATGKQQGRGILMLGKHAPMQEQLPMRKDKSISFPLTPPISLVNSLTLKLFNTLYFHRPLKAHPGISHFMPFFYPLDGIGEWNRMYGRRGFYQYQCVLPPQNGRQATSDLLGIIAKRGAGSFLAVLKVFGDKPSRGLLSFPRPGATLALDFPNQGSRTLQLFNELDAVVRQAGGAIYPAKDARMPGDLFRTAYPLWQTFSEFIDPQFSSGFWRRVME